MKEFSCSVCGYVYNPDENENVDFIELDEFWVCPVCAASKDAFHLVEK